MGSGQERRLLHGVSFQALFPFPPFFWLIISLAIVFLVLSVIDVSFNAAGGPAAVATGAHVNGDSLTQKALRLGALAAVTKSGVLAFVVFLDFANLNIAAYLLLVIVTSVFGIAILVTTQVSNLVLGEGEFHLNCSHLPLCPVLNLSWLLVPTPLLIAALVAAVPLQGEGAVYICKSVFLQK